MRRVLVFVGRSPSRSNGLSKTSANNGAEPMATAGIWFRFGYGDTDLEQSGDVNSGVKNR
jgi:hypothetical protein